jgi:transcription initiation factor TFIIIB Brf1 subunit/transcription initiation factor TFIIB
MDERELVCINCGFAHIVYRHCKIVCENCGFMLDCSDLDVGGEVQRAYAERQREKRREGDVVTPLGSSRAP